MRFLQGALVICLQVDIAMWVLRKVRKIHCAYTNPVPFLLATSLVIHEKNWKCLDFLALGFTRALLKYFHQPNSVNSCSQSGNSCDLSLCTSSDSPFFCFRFLWIHAADLQEALHSYFHFLYWIFGVSVDIKESCDEDDGEVGEGVVEEELSDKPRTTNAT